MHRIISIAVLLSLFCSLAAANVGVQLLCSHNDGFGHVVDFDTHEEETHKSCGHGQISNTHRDHPVTPDESACEDTEVPDSEWDGLSSNSDRSVVKAPSILNGFLGFLIQSLEAKIDTVSTPPLITLFLESESRLFAKIIQIRC